MKKSILFLVSILLFASCQESLEDRAARELKDFTEKQCPTPVVEFQRTDSAVYEPTSKTIHYYMSFCGKADDAKIISASSKNLRSAILKNLKIDTKKKAYKDAGFNFQYTFHSDKNPSKVLFDAKFSSREYKQ